MKASFTVKSQYKFLLQAPISTPLHLIETKKYHIEILLKKKVIISYAMLVGLLLNVYICCSDLDPKICKKYSKVRSHFK
jgi:hypothetical protein